ncbi:MAG TPA: hypothetical protein VG848_03030 [Acetobacteraceae bacterium]|jgi:flagellar basal body-associated protein FliL|nr:hypothetical protein [Acetobacteraceae bacterium]
MKKWLLWAAIGMMALAMLAGDGLAVFFWKEKAAAAPAHAEAAGRPISQPASLLPPRHIYLATLPKFVAVLSTDGAGDSTYAEIALTFSTYDPRAVDAFGNVLPIIQAAVISEVMQNGSALATGDESARTAMTHQALLAVNRIIGKTSPALGVSAFASAYLTDFLIQ